jgi:manganese oxidase
MAMGSAGMGEMSEMEGMAVPRNSIPMRGGKGPFGPIDMGGMFTLLKVRDRLPASGDGGWYAHPEGTLAQAVSLEELRRAGLPV